MYDWYADINEPTMGIREYFPGSRGIKEPGGRWQPQTYVWSSEAEKRGQQEKGIRSGKSALWAQIEGLQSMRQSLGGSMDVYTNWMIGNTISSLKNRLNRMDSTRAIGRGQTSQMIEENIFGGKKFEDEVGPGVSRMDRFRRFAEMGREKSDRDYQGQDLNIPIPAWLKKFFTQRAEQANKEAGARQPSAHRGAAEKETETKDLPNWGTPFIPMGAQEELNPEQMMDMIAYMGWAKGGRPTAFNEKGMDKYLQGIKSAPDWFKYYAEKSKGLFPRERRHETMRGRWR